MKEDEEREEEPDSLNLRIARGMMAREEAARKNRCCSLLNFLIGLGTFLFTVVCTVLILAIVIGYALTGYIGGVTFLYVSMWVVLTNVM